MSGGAAWATALVFFSLLCCVLMSVTIRKLNLYLFPESASFILVGFLIGLVNWAANPDHYTITFNTDTFLYGFLPVIIFEAGYSMNKREFFNNVGVITTLAILGTLISTLVVGYGLYFLEGTGLFTLSNNPIVTLLFGSLISATDPVATLAVFSALKVDRTLYSIVFGEAVMNDAVAIALYQTFEGFVDDPNFDTTDLMIALGMFVAKFAGSFCIGNLVAMASSLFLKHVKLDSPTLVTGFAVTIAYATYAFNEGIKLSGIIAIFFLGISMRHYTMQNVDSDAHHSLENLLHSVAYLCESLIYVYIGQSAFSVVHVFDINLILFSVLLILVGRALHVFPIIGISNLTRKENPITGRFQLMIWYAGLRGAIAFALSLLLPESEYKTSLVTTTFVIVLLTTLLIGSSTIPVLRSLKIRINDDPALDDPNDAERREREFAQSLPGRFLSYDEKFLRPRLTNKVSASMLINSPPGNEADEETALLDGRRGKNSTGLYDRDH